MKTPFEIDDYRALLLGQRPLIDVRAPIEYAAGSLPGACNLPLMNNAERHQVGICYRQHGQQAAIDLGHQLICPELREQRILAWREYITRHPQAAIYCARGGLRSQITQRWLANSGVFCARVSGGYKALRSFMLDYLGSFSADGNVLILSGMTGTGKTSLIKQLTRAIDLEGAANHKGSSFGRPLDEQPNQANFENRIALDLLKLADAEEPTAPVVIEDESRMIGARQLPPALLTRMAKSPIALIDMAFEQRLENLWQEYVVDRHRQTLVMFGEDGDLYFASHITDSLLRIKKRLGGARTQQLLAQMQHAIARQQHDGFAAHRNWLRVLMRDYYDPMYRYQLNQNAHSIAFRGSAHEVADWLASTTSQRRAS